MKTILTVISCLAFCLCLADPSLVIESGSMAFTNKAYISINEGRPITPNYGTPFYSMNKLNCSASTNFYGPEGMLDALTIVPSSDLGNVTVYIYSGSYHPNAVSSVIQWWNISTSNSGTCSLTFRFRSIYLGNLTLTDLAIYEYQDGQWQKINENLDSSGSSGDFSYITFSGVNISSTKKGSHSLILSSKNEHPLPVQLSAFNVSLSANGYAKLEWVTQTESGMLGYYIYRGTTPDLNAAVEISPLISATNTSHPVSYFYEDKQLSNPGRYYYWLQNVELNGHINFYGFIPFDYNIDNGGTPPIPLITGISNIWPNPFNPEVNIEYSLKQDDIVKLQILNAQGQIVRVLEQANKNAGTYRIQWDGKDSYGRNCASGLYLIHLNCSGKSYIKKGILLK